jgi:hypothetical protein
MDGQAEILKRVIGPAALECIRGPLAEARGLGNLAYSAPS